MLSPIDKLRSGVNDIIQIVITTSCTLNCSNCTQLLPFRKDYKHMTLDCFREAVQSLKEWPGVIGIFGGNPCSHPQFHQICEILAEEIPEQHRRGLWSNDLLKHGYICRKTFFPDGRFNLNAHGDYKAARDMELFLPGKMIAGSERKQSIHGPILVAPMDMAVTSDPETCDINQKWSGAIVERKGRPYAYFCEVAAAMDGVTDGNRGIPAIGGWWRSPIGEFGSQLEICSVCAVPLRLQGRPDNYEVYDISPAWRAVATSKRQISVKDPTLEGQGRELTDYLGHRS